MPEQKDYKRSVRFHAVTMADMKVDVQRSDFDGIRKAIRRINKLLRISWWFAEDREAMKEKRNILRGLLR